MASSLAMMGMMRGAQAGMAVGDAYKAKLNAEMQSAAIGMQMEEISDRAEISSRNIIKQGERVQAEQQGAYIKAGVALEGSAMEVVSDTVAEAAESAMLTRRQADYDMMGLAMQQASLDEKSSDLNLLLNSTAGVGSAYAGYQTDKYNHYKGTTSNSSTKGIEG